MESDMTLLVLAAILAAAPGPRTGTPPASPNKLVFSRSGHLARIDPDGSYEE
jgi:hypothetical protein